MNRLSCLLQILCLVTFVGCSSERPVATKSAEVAQSKREPKNAAALTKATESQPEVATLSDQTSRPDDGFNWLTRDEVADGWIRLFDGETLFGWKSNGKLTWTAANGVITANSSDAADQGLLISTTRFADYELRCDYRVEKGGNSGVFLRTVPNPKDPAIDCYELNMCDSKPTFATASLVKRANPTKLILGDGEWHSFNVRLDGPLVNVKFDGEDVLEYTDNTDNPLKTGHIGLQMNGGKIEFRNIYLKPLGTTPLFDGKTLSGWQTVPGSKSEFTVNEGTIQVTNGRGFLETELVAGNFVLQFDAITNGDKLNSGIFFRAMKGTEVAPSHGYEFQIHNGFKAGNRAQPEDHGTGGIFKRVAARKVISNDREWLTGTLIADGPHLSTWVNGTQVVDWTDERPEHENPREGRRVDAGHLSLQGHDPTTDLAFRNLRLAETPK